MGGRPVEFRIGADAVDRIPEQGGHAHIIGHLGDLGAIHHRLRDPVQSRMDTPVIPQRRDIDVSLSVGIDVLQVHLYRNGLRDLEALRVDDADGVVIGVVRRELAGNAAGVGNIESAGMASDAFRLVTHLDTSGNLLGFQVNPVYLALRVLGIRDDVIAVLVIASCRVGSRPGSDIGILVIESDVPRRGNRNRSDFRLVFGGDDLHDAGIVHDHPEFIPVDRNIVTHVAQAGAHTRIHLLESARDVVSVGEPEEIQARVVGAHAPLVQDEQFPGRFRETGDIDLLAGQVRVLGRRFRHGILAARAERQRTAKQKQHCFFH